MSCISLSVLRAISTSVHCVLDNSLAHASPIPKLAPVIKMVLFWKCRWMVLLCREGDWKNNFSDIIDYYKAQIKLGRKHFQPILLLGEPGIGKTYFANAMAEAMGIKSYFKDKISL